MASYASFVEYGFYVKAVVDEFFLARAKANDRAENENGVKELAFPGRHAALV